jgi:hypothetical protein
MRLGSAQSFVLPRRFEAHKSLAAFGSHGVPSQEATKMKTHFLAERDCEIAAVRVHPGSRVAAKDLPVELKDAG